MEQFLCYIQVDDLNSKHLESTLLAKHFIQV